MDTIADMFTRIKNARKRKHKEVVLPFSRLKFDIAKILEKEKFIEKAKKVKNGNKLNLEIILEYEGETLEITSIKRVSKLGRRVYKGWREIPKVLNGMGIAIVSTPKGVMTDKQARKEKVGGELICEIY